MPMPFFPEVTLAWKAAGLINGKEIPVAEFLDASSKFIMIFGVLRIRNVRFAIY
jgi:hypothetical protein